MVKTVRDKGQYVLAFGVIASLLVVANIPIFVVFFFGIFAYFLAKMFSSSGKHRTRSIFEFYLSAHEILREDLRCWYGFEINETIERGENILKSMHVSPTLVHFAIGSLYNKVGDHSSAVKHLSYVAENPESFEASVVYPSAELRNYVNVLRKIERDPSSAPLTSAAIRSLERGRKMKTESLLTQSRSLATSPQEQDVKLLQVESEETVKYEDRFSASDNQQSSVSDAVFSQASYSSNGDQGKTIVDRNGKQTVDHTRKPITELLHDIYDRNPQ